MILSLLGPIGPPLRRSWRRLRSRLLPGPVDFVYSRAYQLDLPLVPVDSLRGERVLSYLAGEGLVIRDRVHRPRAASVRSLRRVHTDSYLESLRDPEALTRVLGLRLDEATQDRVLDLQRTMAGGTVLAVRRALTTGRAAMNLGGGFHHAFADRGERFCVLNDVAVAIESARVHGFDGRILVVDLDVHDGDGTRALFAEDSEVHTFSIHNQTNEPEAAVEATVVELGFHVRDAEYLEALENRLPPVLEAFCPELVIYLAGTDPACDDEIGDWEITGEAMLWRDRFVTERIQRGAGRRVPLAVTLAGGYGREAWRYTARYAAWLAAGCELPHPPSTEDVTLARYRYLSRILTPRELTGAEEDETWSLSEEDVMGGLAGTPVKSRFLDYYTKSGIELALERAGLFDRLRSLGYRPVLDMDLTNAAGETIRLFGDLERTELLLELRARRDRSTLPGFEMLRVEWLLLQNPRAEFTPSRPRLPGQEHPGLGMLKDAVAFLVLACERLGLDGMVFAPSHYHLAAQSRRMLRFADPEDEARFRAFREALRGQPLAEATRLADAGQVMDRMTGEPRPWQPAPMVLPVSEELRERLQGKEYERGVQEAREGLNLIVDPTADRVPASD